jgi:hypothetical protein
MEATYPPPAGQAVCPHCAAETGPIILDRPALELAALRFRCLTCQGTWNALRTRDGVQGV